MIGVVKWSEEQKVTLERITLLGMPVLQVSLSPDGRWGARRLRRAGRLLGRKGVQRVLVPDGFDGWEELRQCGLWEVDPVPLYRTVADRLVLARLEYIGVEPERAHVVLRGQYVDGDMARTARLLCPKVRAVTVRAERGGEKLMWELYREFGAAPQRETGADVTVRFGGAAQPGELVLCGRPDLLGLGLETEGIPLPKWLEQIPLLTALWQGGRLAVEELQVRITGTDGENE